MRGPRDAKSTGRKMLISLNLEEKKKKSNIWRLNNTLLNNQQITEDRIYQKSIRNKIGKLILKLQEKAKEKY